MREEKRNRDAEKSGATLLTPIEQKLAEAMREQSPAWTQNCPEPEAWLDWIEQGAAFPDSERLTKHLFTCGFCRREYDAIQETLAAIPIEAALPAPDAPAFAAPPLSLRERMRRWLASLTPRPFSLALGGAAIALIAFLSVKTAAGFRAESDKRAALAQVASLTQELREAKRGEGTGQAQQIADLQIRVDALTKDKAKADAALGQAWRRLAALKAQNGAQTALLNDGDAPVMKDRAGNFTRKNAPLPEAAQKAIENPAGITLLADAGKTYRSLLSEPESTRGGTETSPLLSPDAEIVEEDRPTFRWKSYENAAHYEITVRDEAYNPVFTLTVAQRPGAAQMRAGSKQALRRGKKYLWSLSATDQAGSPVKPNGSRASLLTDVEAKFAVLDEDAFRALKQNRQSPLTLGALYVGAGLFDKAQAQFKLLEKRNPDSNLPKQWIAQTERLRRELKSPRKP